MHRFRRNNFSRFIDFWVLVSEPQKRLAHVPAEMKTSLIIKDDFLVEMLLFCQAISSALAEAISYQKVMKLQFSLHIENFMQNHAQRTLS